MRVIRYDVMEELGYGSYFDKREPRTERKSDIK